MGLFNKKELLRIGELEQEISKLKRELEVEKEKSDRLGISSYEEAKRKIDSEQKDANIMLSQITEEITKLNESRNQNESELKKVLEALNTATVDLEKVNKNLSTQRKKVTQGKELYKALLNGYERENKFVDTSIAEEYAPTVTTQLQSFTYQELKKEYKANEKTINIVLKKYEDRYTTKANKAIYTLMVIALQAELQNILTSMKYDKLDVAINQVHEMCNKYITIADDGSQTISSTLKRFIGEIEHLFENAIKIEYEYYIKKAREKEEQAAIREQMRQEAEERKLLAQQKQQVEKEESKYINEIEKVKQQISDSEDEDAIFKLEQKIKDLQSKLDLVEEKKEEIINRQNGKAGNVYVISNLGSFGDDVFKVGMTRRLEPMDRIKELGSASVPFEFDVHAMIFSEDAVALENKLHQILNKNRVNKVNLRKEFFKISLDDIEKIVLTEDPAAAFNKTMLAENYRLSLSMSEQY